MRKRSSYDHSALWRAINKNNLAIARLQTDVRWLRNLIWKLWVPILVGVLLTLISTLVK